MRTKKAIERNVICHFQVIFLLLGISLNAFRHLLGLENRTKADILISDISGNIIQQYRWEIRNHALNIPIATLNPGIYIISISSKEQSLQTKFYKK